MGTLKRYEEFIVFSVNDDGDHMIPGTLILRDNSTGEEVHVSRELLLYAILGKYYGVLFEEAPKYEM